MSGFKKNLKRCKINICAHVHYFHPCPHLQPQVLSIKSNEIQKESTLKGLRLMPYRSCNEGKENWLIYSMPKAYHLQQWLKNSPDSWCAIVLIKTFILCAHGNRNVFFFKTGTSLQHKMRNNNKGSQWNVTNGYTTTT